MRNRPLAANRTLPVRRRSLSALLLIGAALLGVLSVTAFCRGAGSVVQRQREVAAGVLQNKGRGYCPAVLEIIWMDLAVVRAGVGYGLVVVRALLRVSHASSVSSSLSEKPGWWVGKV